LEKAKKGGLATHKCLAKPAVNRNVRTRCMGGEKREKLRERQNKMGERQRGKEDK